MQHPFVTPGILANMLLRSKILSVLNITHIIIVVIIIYFLVNTHKEEDIGMGRKSLQGYACLWKEPLSRRPVFGNHLSRSF